MTMNITLNISSASRGTIFVNSICTFISIHKLFPFEFHII